jgi:hypothetical protein
MANPFQQQSLRRKVTYFTLIVVLFTAALVFRRAPAYGVESQAEKLSLREQSLGEVELTDKLMRLTLTGSRGFAVCALWYTAIEKQKKHEWNELELLVRSFIKLQPHFITPWLYQSWNLAYNVSVECDRVKDKYFYVAQGINLLSQGERQNINHPDMRFYIGLYTQNKMGISDENNTLRSLYQMSCIDPVERDPNRFRRTVNGVTVIDLDQFETFCQNHPFLVRRLRDYLRCSKPEDVVDFLAANQKIPSWFEDRSENVPEGEQTSRLRPLDDRFPVLPPAQTFNPQELTYDSTLGDDFDNYAGARAWFGYAQDPIKARPPRYMAQIIFENYPARAQCYVAERREQEGWFDDGWEIKDWFPRDKARPEGAKRVAKVGAERNWAGESWDRGFQMYKEYGETHGMLKTPKEYKDMSDPEKGQYEHNRQMTNFPHHYHKALVEKTPEAITARRVFFKADQLRKHGDRELALEEYEKQEAFPAWKKILLANKEFRQDVDVQEDTYIMQRKYLAVLRDKRLPTLRQLLLVQEFLSQGAIAPPAGQLAWLPIHVLPTMRVPLQGPFDGTDEDGVPLIGQQAINSAINHYHLTRDPGVAPPPSPKLPPVKPIKTPRAVEVR